MGSADFGELSADSGIAVVASGAVLGRQNDSIHNAERRTVWGASPSGDESSRQPNRKNHSYNGQRQTFRTVGGFQYSELEHGSRDYRAFGRKLRCPDIDPAAAHCAVRSVVIILKSLRRPMTAAGNSLHIGIEPIDDATQAIEKMFLLTQTVTFSWIENEVRFNSVTFQAAVELLALADGVCRVGLALQK